MTGARSRMKLLAIGAVLVAATSCTPAPSVDRPRHVVLISLDTTRADRFGFYGNRTVRTPNLDRLAGQAIVLLDFMTVAPTTLASHTSLFTGNYPQTHGVPRNGFTVDDANVTLAETLAENGFTTAGFAASFALSARFGIAQGFQRYDESFDREGGVGGRMQNERDAASVTDAVLGYLDERPVPQRLFLFVHYFDAHAPYDAPAPYDRMYDPRGREGLPGWFQVARECTSRGGARTPDGERLALQYDAEISYMDHHVGRLIEGLKERDILDDALVVVTSDHGENFWEHDECFDHGWTTYQEAIRAVGILRMPRHGAAGRRIEELAATVDLYPTILGAVGIPQPRGIDGRAIDLFAKSPHGGHARFGQATKPWEEVETDSRWRNMSKARFVRKGPYKLIQIPYAGREELYDLATDPGEQANLLEGDLSPEVGARAGELRRKLEAWAASAHPLPSEFDPEQREETIERLKGLGYLGEGR